jgi:hypothetical protein
MLYYEKHKHEMPYVPFYLLDEGIRDLVCVFNRLGYTTIFSCEGHEDHQCPDIIFSIAVTDEDILKLANKMLMGSYKGCFYKWVRKCDDSIHINWMWKLDYQNNELSKRDTKQELENIVKLLDAFVK